MFYSYHLLSPAGFIIALALVACAQPKYENARAPSANSNWGQDASMQKVAGCPLRFRESKFCLSWKWEEMPTSTREGSFVFKIFRGNVYDDSPVATDFSVIPAVVLWMPMGEGHTSTPTSVRRLDVGTYRVEKVFFVMPGEWHIYIQVIGENSKDEAVFTLYI